MQCFLKDKDHCEQLICRDIDETISLSKGGKEPAKCQDKVD